MSAAADFDPWEEDKKLAEQLSKLGELEINRTLKSAALSNAKVGVSRPNTEAGNSNMKAAGEARRGKHPATVERRQKIAEALAGVAHTPERRANISASKAGKPTGRAPDPVHTAKLIAGKKAKFDARNAELRDMHQRGMTLQEIAIAIDRTPRSVKRVLVQLGLL